MKVKDIIKMLEKMPKDYDCDVNDETSGNVWSVKGICLYPISRMVYIDIE